MLLRWVVKSILISVKVRRFISEIDVDFFSRGELFNSLYGLNVSVFQYPLCMFFSALSSEEAREPAVTGQR